MADKIKAGIFFSLFLILLLPLLEKAFPFINSAPLNGEYTIAPCNKFSWDSWYSKGYADSSTRYINDNMGFRPDLVRMNNQVDYTLFKKIHSEWRLLGDNACIFQDKYINSYLGKDYDGYDYIFEKVRQMKAIQDTLRKLGKSFVFVHPACKAFFYPEFLPREYKNAPRGTTNFETYKRIGDSLGLNQVDMNTWFVAMKRTSKELLYPKQGFHWSEYGALLAGDSLVKYIERLRLIHMVHPVWTTITHTNSPRYDDNDIARSMNTIFPLANETFSYPEATYAGDKTAAKPKVIYIGDSFLFQWLNDGFFENTDSEWQIWYYNQMLINRSFGREAKHSMENYDRVREIENADCIVVMFTSRNLSKMGVNFVEDTYKHFFPKK